MADNIALRCVNGACRRTWPRAVLFCPYCGTRQQSLPAPPPAVAPPKQAGTSAVTPPPARAAAVPPPAPPASPAPAQAAAADKPHVVFDESKLRIPELDPELGYRPAAPPRRKPIGIGTWLIVLMALTAIWLFAKPRPNAEVTAKARAEARVEAMLALVSACRLDEARGALAELKSSKAPPALVARAQNALREARPGCDKKQAKAKEWADTGSAVEALLQAASPEKAAARLQAFTQRWGDSDAVRALRDRIDDVRVANLLDQADACMAARDGRCADKRVAAAEVFQRPEFARRIADLRAAVSALLEATLLDGQGAGATTAAPPPPRSSITTTEPPPAPPQSTPQQQAARMLASARRDIGQANYKVAIDRLDSCATMVDAGNRECLALKQTAQQLQRDMQRCLQRHADWVDGRCQ